MNKRSGWVHQAAVWYDRMINFLACLAAIIVMGMVGLLLYEVFMRYVIGKPPPWAWEICETMLCLITFLGAAWLLKGDGHVSVDIVRSQLNTNVRRATNIVTSTLGMVICLLITVAGAAITVDHFQAGITIPGYLDMPKAPFLLVIPLGCFMLSIQFLRQIVGYILEWKNLKTEG
jgi:TRAP-type C4-dicarboxylate transport system permease small subunit